MDGKTVEDRRFPRSQAVHLKTVYHIESRDLLKS
ncbi:MAG: hypothetical protein ACI8YQ_003773, partial [Polaribacter sp.]